ncbi:MAG: hypothetical protein O7H40_14455 [Gammaproteobacteria bacterium]|nr:hypothetical protein [Gammaproteobacteria bacterium]
MSDQALPRPDSSVNPYAAPTVNLVDAGGTLAQAEETRRAHISHEASVRSIGLLYYLSSASFWVMLAVMFVGRSDSAQPIGQTVGLMVVLLAFGIGFCLVGFGLRKLRGWVRIPTGIASVLGLIAFPLGTLINGYILYLLFSKKGGTVFSVDYAEVIALTPHIKYRSILAWVALGALVLLIAIGVASQFA